MGYASERDLAIALSLGPDVWALRWIEAADPAERWAAAEMMLRCLDGGAAGAEFPFLAAASAA